jgi:hypothetical protein
MVFWAIHSRLEPVIDAAHAVKRHWYGILRWFDSKIANDLIEGTNSLVQAVKAKARGYARVRRVLLTNSEEPRRLTEWARCTLSPGDTDTGTSTLVTPFCYTVYAKFRGK